MGGSETVSSSGEYMAVDSTGNVGNPNPEWQVTVVGMKATVMAMAMAIALVVCAISRALLSGN